MDNEKVAYPYNGILSIKKNEILIHATTQMYIKNIMLNERSYTQKATYCIISFI